MNIDSIRFKQLFTLGILLILIVSFSLCFGEDDNGNGNGDNGENGDNGGGNGNGNNNNTTQIINITEIRQEPQIANQGANVDIISQIESKNPISKVEIIICVGEVCYAPELMIENPAGSNRYLYSYQVPRGDTEPPKIKINIKVTDSLSNTRQSEDFYLDII